MSAALTVLKRAIGGDSLSDALREVTDLNNVRDQCLLETASQLAVGLIGGYTSLVVPDDREFRKRCPQWRQALLDLCQARIAQAEADLLPILAEAYVNAREVSENDDLAADLLLQWAERVAGLILEANREQVEKLAGVLRE